MDKNFVGDSGLEPSLPFLQKYENQDISRKIHVFY